MTSNGDHMYTQFYFVDEAGMVGAEQLGVMAARIDQAHAKRTSSANGFGGKSVILFGHHAQLPPTGDRRMFPEPNDGRTLFDYQTAGRCTYEGFFTDVCVLREQRRQRVATVHASGRPLTKEEKKEERDDHIFFCRAP